MVCLTVLPGFASRCLSLWGGGGAVRRQVDGRLRWEAVTSVWLSAHYVQHRVIPFVSANTKRAGRENDPVVAPAPEAPLPRSATSHRDCGPEKSSVISLTKFIWQQNIGQRTFYCFCVRYERATKGHIYILHIWTFYTLLKRFTLSIRSIIRGTT